MQMLLPVQARLSRYVHAMTRDRDVARDILSETILAAYEKFETVKQPDSFFGFLVMIARRKFYKHLWRQKFFRRYDESDSDRMVDHGTSPDAHADVAILHAALAKLPVLQREAVSLFEIAGFSLVEIAEIQNSSLSAVKARVCRARAKLATLLGARNVESGKVNVVRFPGAIPVIETEEALP